MFKVSVAGAAERRVATTTQRIQCCTRESAVGGAICEALEL